MTQDERSVLRDETQEKIKQCYEDRAITFPNAGTYKLLEIPYREGMKIMSLSQKWAKTSEVGSDDWFALADKIMQYFSFVDENESECVLSKMPKHFDSEEHKKHYITFVTYAAGMISYPFMSEN